jgi:hypothetical protein
MDYKEEQNGEIEALLSIYEGEIEGKKQAGKKNICKEGAGL